MPQSLTLTSNIHIKGRIYPLIRCTYIITSVSQYPSLQYYTAVLIINGNKCPKRDIPDHYRLFYLIEQGGCLFSGQMLAILLPQILRENLQEDMLHTLSPKGELIGVLIPGCNGFQSLGFVMSCMGRFCLWTSSVASSIGHTCYGGL